MSVQELEFLGFIINSINMTIRLSDAKILCIRENILIFLAFRKPTIKDLASVIGTLISTFPALKFHKGEFMAPVTINP